ncbi:MAG: hypothetical protein EXR64_03050 [Dehalococcoidia bacterium]|nr:hypothetical protein [Dehalococcoidia bacterium]
MEWALFAAVLLAATAYIALPRRADDVARDIEADVAELHAARAAILAALRDLDEDAAAGRMAAEDRAAGRRALGPALREATERLRARDEPSR